MRNLKAKVVSAAVSTALIACMVPAPAMADGTEIVTLGADLTSEQRTTVLQFFGLDESSLSTRQVITVTNSDEHKYCDATIPKEITGSRTLSCSYIQPTTSGGINVKTANLTYVNSSTLYNALQTAGVTNCNLVVTAPFEVSGTGALTGVFMAYDAAGQSLDDEKEETAIEEMYDTAAMAETYGDEVIDAIGEAKDAVISSSNMSTEEIKSAIQEAAANHNITLSDSDLETLVQLLEKLQSLDYDMNAFSETLSNIDANTGGILEAIQNFFASISSFFTGLFGGNSGSASSIIDNLNTNVFSLDK